MARGRKVARRSAEERNGAAIGRKPAGDERGDGRLATTGWAEERDGLAGVDGKGQLIEHANLGAAGIAELNPLERHRREARAGRCRRRLGRGRYTDVVPRCLRGWWRGGRLPRRTQQRSRGDACPLEGRRRRHGPACGAARIERDHEEGGGNPEFDVERCGAPKERREHCSNEGCGGHTRHANGFDHKPKAGGWRP
eukprot:6061035-Prymnesium_polylepis.1